MTNVNNPIDGPGKYKLRNGKIVDLVLRDRLFSPDYVGFTDEVGMVHLYDTNEVDPEEGHLSVEDEKYDVMEKVE